MRPYTPRVKCQGVGSEGNMHRACCRGHITRGGRRVDLGDCDARPQSSRLKVRDKWRVCAREAPLVPHHDLGFRFRVESLGFRV